MGCCQGLGERCDEVKLGVGLYLGVVEIVWSYLEVVSARRCE